MTLTPYWSDDTVMLYLGDCREVLAEMADTSVDAIVTDPPYELTGGGSGGFMGKAWDASGVAFDPETWRQCLRVLNPGGHLLAFGGTRTYHRMVVAIEDAGFEIRDSLHWIYGGGFPKSFDVSKAIDKAGGASPREQAAVLQQARVRAGLSRDQVAQALGCTVTSVRDWEEGRRRAVGAELEHLLPSPDYRNKLADLLGYTQDERVVVGLGGGSRGLYETGHRGVQYGSAVTALARQWEGWGTALKPTHEPIALGRKALGGTVASNVLTYGTGALNIDGCRVGDGDDRTSGGRQGSAPQPMSWGQTTGIERPEGGRWPANVVFTHSPLCIENRPCEADCPVAELDRQSGTTRTGTSPLRRNTALGVMNDDGWQPKATEGVRHTGEGGASRFFPTFRYQAKAPASERPRLDDGTAWPTVKPVDLMRWLVRLVTPPGGVVLDPFGGTGTTAEACVVEGFRCVLIERDPIAVELIKTRLSKPIALDLFGGGS